MNRMTIGKEKSVNRMTISWITAGVFALAVGSVGAHHSMTMFDPVKEVTLEGVVKEFQYTNPHSWLLVDVTNEDGTVTTWGFEAEGPSTLRRAGILPSTLPPGLKITITGHPMTDGRPGAAWITAVTEDGTVIDPRTGFAVPE